MPLDRAKPLYQQVVDTLSARIASGALQSGAPLPAEPKLAASLGVSQGTLRKALDLMEAESLLDRRHGIGTFVARGDLIETASRFVDDAGDDLWAELRSQVLVEEPLPAPAAAELQQDVGTEGWCIEQLCCLANQPALMERIHIAKSDLPDLTPAMLPDHVPLLWRNLAGRICQTITHRIRSVAAPHSVTWAFGSRPGTPILRIDQTTYDLDEVPIEYRITHVAPGPWTYRTKHILGKVW